MRISDWSSDVCSSDLATALAAIGAAYSLCTADQAQAASFIDRALALDPNNAWGWMRAGWLKTLNGEMKNALACFERALALSPFDPFTFNIYRSEEHTSELQSLMRISYAVLCLKKKNT